MTNTKSSKNVNLPIQIVDEECIPTYGSTNAAGADLRANIEKSLVLKPSKSMLIPTGIFMEIPEGFEVQIRPRSGLAIKNQITVLNTPGTIDSDYRGEIGIILINHSDKDFVIVPKMRIAQMVIAKVYQAEFEVRSSLSETARGEGGFGHSGTH